MYKLWLIVKSLKLILKYTLWSKGVRKCRYKQRSTGDCFRILCFTFFKRSW
jgi:hypothetical protein